MKFGMNLSTEENRQFWLFVARTVDRVNTWPEHKRPSYPPIEKYLCHICGSSYDLCEDAVNCEIKCYESKGRRIMPKKIEKWECGECNQQYDSETEAFNCETIHREAVEMEKVRRAFNKQFPVGNSANTFRSRCCDKCGKRVMMWGRELHNAYSELQPSILGGIYCTECINELKKLIVYAIHGDPVEMTKNKERINRPDSDISP